MHGYFVYFIRVGENGPVKIGRAYSPESRMQYLQCMNYEKLILLRKIETTYHDSRAMERYMHFSFIDNWLRGEWFRFSPEMLTVQPPSGPIPMRWATKKELYPNPTGAKTVACVHRRHLRPGIFGPPQEAA